MLLPLFRSRKAEPDVNVAVDVDPQYIDSSGRLNLRRADLAVYSHGEYFALGDRLGSFGFSVRKRKGGNKAGKRG